MTKKLIFTLHDFGMSTSVNEGIEFAINHPDNLATEYSLLANAPGSMDAAGIAKKYSISVNLCISLTSFAPLSGNCKTMVDNNGNFKKADTSTWDFSNLDSYDPQEIADEIEAQYQWFVKNVGKKPSALTSQKSEHGDPKILEPLVDLAKRESIPLRTPAWKWFDNYAAQSYIEDMGLKYSHNVIIGCKDWRGKFGYDLETEIDTIITKVSQAPGISDLITFCGFVDRELIDISSVTWQRGIYLNLLQRKPEILRKLKDNFELISYASL